MSSTLRTVDRGARGLLKALEAVKKSVIRVGILSDGAKRSRSSSPGRLSLVAVAALHEFGTDRLPKRSFVRDTVNQKLAEIQQLQRVVTRAVLTAKISPDQAAAQFGAKVVAMMQRRISGRIAPELAPSTILRKGSSVPLVDTGQLKASITWKAEA